MIVAIDIPKGISKEKIIETILEAPIFELGLATEYPVIIVRRSKKIPIPNNSIRSPLNESGA